MPKSQKFRDAGEARRLATREIIGRHQEEFDELHAKLRVERGLEPVPEPTSSWRRPYDSKAYRLAKQLHERGFSWSDIRGMLEAAGEQPRIIQKAIDRARKEQ